MNRFVVLEGIDGAGTTTACTRVRDQLAAEGHQVHVTREPSTGPIGSLIRQALSHRLHAPGATPLQWQTMALLFAADRIDHVQCEIEPALAKGQLVISDRYDYSSIAYQTLVGGGTDDVRQWVKEINCHARRPDLTIVVDVDPDEAARRRSVRAGDAELYETQEIQRKLAAFYQSIDQYFDDPIVHVDGNQSAQEVANAVLDAVRKVL